jgi:hypothetical protein
MPINQLSYLNFQSFVKGKVTIPTMVALKYACACCAHDDPDSPTADISDLIPESVEINDVQQLEMFERSNSDVRHVIAT